MRDLDLDLRFAVRTFAKNPAFTAVIVLTLALGIGANTAIFSLMDQALLRSLPVAEPSRLVVVDAPGAFTGSSHIRSDSGSPLSHPMFEGLRDGNDVFTGMLGYYMTGLHFTVDGHTDDVVGGLVSGGFFDVLGLRPAAGRLLTPEDDRVPGGHPVVVLGHGFWTKRFAADPGVVGRSVLVNGQAMNVIGVAPRGFRGVETGENVDVYLSLMMQPRAIPVWSRGLGDWRVRWLTVMARLRPGVSMEQASARLNGLYAQLTEEDLAHVPSASARVRDLYRQKRLVLRSAARGAAGLEDARTALVVLMGMVGLVLLIACANVANLLLARASSRQKEIALRLAFGASRGRLVRQLLVESLLFALAGGLLGLGLAVWTGHLLLRALPGDAGAVFSADPDLRMGLFALLLVALTGMAFGLVPALQSTRLRLAPTLKDEAASLAGGTAPFRLRKGLVVAQIALSLLLLIGAGLFTRSLMKLRALHPGFEPALLLTFVVDPALNGYDLPRRVGLLERLHAELSVEPGVRAVSMASVPLMTDSGSRSTVRVDGYEPKEGEDMSPNYNGVGPGFFATLGIPLLSGREFTEADGADAPRVVIVNEAFARYFFGAADPIGRRIGVGRASTPDITIVGLVRDGKAASLRETTRRFFYQPYAQQTDLGEMAFYVRSGLDPAALTGRIRQIVQAADPTIPVVNMMTMEAQIGQSLFVDRMVATLSAAFGLLATLLATVGLYGVMSYAVSRRTREIGVRVALGAERRTVLIMVLKEVLVLALIGVAFGLPGGYGLGKIVQAQLFQLDAHDPMTFMTATVTLLLAALLAGYFPAARATRVDPMVALRYE
jgi:putative ABC transport system permease protein